MLRWIFQGYLTPVHIPRAVKYKGIALERCLIQRIFSVLSFTGKKQNKTQNKTQKPPTTTKPQRNNEVLSKRQQQPHQCICKIAAGEAHSGKKPAANRLSKTQFAGLPVCKSTSTIWGRRESFTRLCQPKVVQRCFIYPLVFKYMGIWKKKKKLLNFSD